MGDAQDQFYELDDRGFVVDLQDLKKWYRHTLRWHEERRRELEKAIEEDTGISMEDLRNKKNRPAYRRWKEANAGAYADLKDTKEIISDLNYTIEWLHTGRQPGGSKRGVERRAAYQREVLTDPVLLQSYKNNSNAGGPSNLSDWERFQLEEALRRLSDRERECYEFAHGQGFSQAYIARMLGIEKSSVKEYVERAQRKVSEELANNMFLI